MSRTRVVSCLFLVVTATVALAAAGRPAQEPPARQPFRAGVDIVEVDVQVVGRDGQPVPDLTPDKFDVRIGGQRRRVSAAQFIRYGDPAAVMSAPVSALGAPTPALTPEQAMTGRRLFMVAIDALSFDPGDSRGVAVATQRFVEGLPDTDLVGLFTFPSGAKVDPTTEHADVVKALDQVSGQKVITTGRFPLQASEVVDFIAGEREPVIRRHCGESGGAGDPTCIMQLESEIATLGGTFEAMAQSSLGMLLDMIDQLAKVPGRKVLVLASAGLPVSDRPGGRPGIGDLPQRLGEAAARANVAIYSLFVDDSMLRQFASEERNARRQMVNVSRESNLLGRWLDQFSGSAGGTMIKVMVDSGEAAYAQIARETAAHYLLAVEPDRSDRSGSSRRIQVRVNHPNVTVRARQWVVLPE